MNITTARLANDVMRTTICLLLMALCIPLTAQTTQKGIVKEYNEKALKTPLAGVELNVRSAGSAVSDKNGNFSLNFLTLKAGDRINVRKIQKDGYEIFNKEALEQWNLNPNAPFTIVMCQSSKFKKIRDNYERQASENYERQYKDEIDALNRLKAENKIKDEEYRKQIKEIQDMYDSQMNNLDIYVDKFSRIDLSELSEAEQEIIELVQQGKFDEAIAKYEEMKLAEKYINGIQQSQEISSAIEQLSEVKNATDKGNENVLEAIYRQVETLKLAGGVKNNTKAADLLREIADADTTNFELQIKTGSHIEDYLANYNEVLKYYTRALNTSIINYGNNHPNIAIAYNYLGSIYDNCGEYALALDYYQKALEINENNFGNNHKESARTLNNLGYIYLNQGDYAKALEYFIKSIEIKEHLLGSNHPEIALSFNNIASVYDKLGEYGKSLECLSKSLKIYSNECGPESKDVALSLINLGTAYYRLSDYSKALECTEKSLEIREKLYGSEHPLVADALNNAAEIYSILGNYTKALEYFEKALEIREQIYGSYHPRIAIVLNNIGNVYKDLEDYDKALELFQASLRIKKAFLGENHPDLGNTLNNIGGVYCEKGYWDIATEYYEKALELVINRTGPEHPNVAITLSNLGYIFSNSGNFSKAIEFYNRALAIEENSLGSTHKEVGSSKFNIGMAYLKAEDYKNALKFFQDACDIFKLRLGENNANVALSHYYIGDTYLAMNNYPQALDSYSNAIRTYENINNPDDNNTIRMLFTDINNIYEKLYSQDKSYENQIREFMVDKALEAIVVEDTPAHQRGLSGNYYLLEYEDWKYSDLVGLNDIIENRKGKPKTVVLLNEEGIRRERFEDVIGVGFALKKVTADEKQHIDEVYKKWKSSEEGNEPAI